MNQHEPMRPKELRPTLFLAFFFFFSLKGERESKIKKKIYIFGICLRDLLLVYFLSILFSSVLSDLLCLCLFQNPRERERKSWVPRETEECVKTKFIVQVLHLFPTFTIPLVINITP